MNHLERLLTFDPRITEASILDLGCGSGKFLKLCRERGLDVHGLDPSSERIERLKDEGYQVVQGYAEALPYGDDTFGFVNMSEVTEHVRDPYKSLEELYRVLKPGSTAYVSIHNRFGIYDHHYHMWFLNWMPRKWADHTISLLGKRKMNATDMQMPSEMHYFWPSTFIKFARSIGFEVRDTRVERFDRKPIKAFLYTVLNPFVLSTTHFILSKPAN